MTDLSADLSPLRGDSLGVRDGGRTHVWDLSRDVLVVGLGAAGGSAAIEARRAGAEVLVVDRFAGGGATGKSAGIIYFGGGTELQTAAGYPDSPQNMFDYLRLEVADAVSEATLRAFCETSVAHFEWLRGLGVPFPVSGKVCKSAYPESDCTLYFSGNELCHPYRDHAVPAPRGHRALGVGLTGHLSAAAMRAGVLDAGGELRPYCRVERLVVDRGGAVLGAVVCELKAPRWLAAGMELCVRYGGGLSSRLAGVLQATLRTLERSCVRHYVRARRGVILCAGGFVFNRALMLAHAPAYADCSMRLGTAGDDGAGILLGAAAGGVTGHMDRCTAWRFIDPPDAWWGGILVDRSGARICNETLYGGKIGELMITGHRGEGTLIVDAATMARGRRQILSGNPQLYQRAFGLINGYVICRSAPTLRQLAARMGIDPDGLAASVATYNAGVRAGVDGLGKRVGSMRPIEGGPYYAIPLDHDGLMVPTPCLTLGGLRTEGLTGEVLGADGAAIPGLYAAGRTAVGVSSSGYVSGLSVADGIFSGRNAGRHAGRHVAPRRSPGAS
jgi:3-oxo-5alpha-steroid 4-dehydrogenase